MPVIDGSDPPPRRSHRHMVQLALDAFDDPAAWSVTRPGGGASDRVAVAATAGQFAGVPGIAVDVRAGALDHRVERGLGPADLRPFTDLQVWVRADRAAGPASGFLLELALGAADLAVDAPTNRWRRMIPVEGIHRWQLVIVTVGDLPDRVRRGLHRMRLRVVSEHPCRAEFASLAAVRAELVGDVEAALLGRLDSAVEIDGQPVRATVAPDAPPGSADRPHLRVRPIAVRPAPERERTVPLRTDYTATGFSLRPSPTAMDLDYAVDAIAGDRAAQRRLAEFLVDRLPPVGTLLVNGRPLPMEWTGPLGTAGDPPVPSAPLRIASSRPAAVPPRPAMPPFNDISVDVDHHA